MNTKLQGKCAQAVHRLYVSAMVLAIIFGSLVVVGTAVLWGHDWEVGHEELYDAKGKSHYDPTLYDEKGKSLGEAPSDPEQLKQILQSGKAGFASGKRINVVASDGTVGSLPSDAATIVNALYNGYRIESSKEKHDRELQEDYDKAAWFFTYYEIQTWNGFHLFLLSLLALIPAVILKGLKEWLCWLLGKGKQHSDDLVPEKATSTEDKE